MNALTTDFLLASLHHLAVFAVFALLIMELMIVKSGLDAAGVRRVSVIDALYGLAAGLVLIAGFARAIWGAKGWDAYADNILFWHKVGVFMLIGLLSLPPTFTYMGWRKRIVTNEHDVPADAEVRSVRKWLHMQSALFLVLPVLAAALARW
jgi:putative membrane protein